MKPDGFDALMQLMEEAGCLIKRGAQISIKPFAGSPGNQSGHEYLFLLLGQLISVHLQVNS